MYPTGNVDKGDSKNKVESRHVVEEIFFLPDSRKRPIRDCDIKIFNLVFLSTWRNIHICAPPKKREDTYILYPREVLIQFNS